VTMFIEWSSNSYINRAYHISLILVTPRIFCCCYRGQITTEYNTVFSGVRVTRSLVLYVMFYRLLFGHCVSQTFFSYIHEENMCMNGGQLLFFSILILVHIGFKFSTNFTGQYVNWSDTYS
jgi:hypothetical protein